MKTIDPASLEWFLDRSGDATLYCDSEEQAIAALALVPAILGHEVKRHEEQLICHLVYGAWPGGRDLEEAIEIRDAQIAASDALEALGFAVDFESP